MRTSPQGHGVCAPYLMAASHMLVVKFSCNVGFIFLPVRILYRVAIAAIFYMTFAVEQKVCVCVSACVRACVCV